VILSSQDITNGIAANGAKVSTCSVPDQTVQRRLSGKKLIACQGNTAYPDQGALAVQTLPDAQSVCCFE